MHPTLVTFPLLLSGFMGIVHASSSQCPLVWTAVAEDLKGAFAGCNQDARFAIRFAFHDAATFSLNTPFYPPAAGGADGSLLLAPGEISRTENSPLEQFIPFLSTRYATYSVLGASAADLIQFAGHMAIRACPGGPIVPTVSMISSIISVFHTKAGWRSLLAGPTALNSRERICCPGHSAQARIMELSPSSSPTRGSASVILPRWSAHTQLQEL